MKRNLVVLSAVGMLSIARIALADPTVHSFLGAEQVAGAQRTTVAQEGDKDRQRTAQRADAGEDRAEFVGTAARTPAQDKVKPHRIPDRLIDVNP